MTYEHPTWADFAQRFRHVEGKKIALVVTGSLSAAYVPYWINFVRGLDLDVELRVLLTRTAETMVSPRTLSALLGRPVERDAWDESDPGHAPHIELTEWADGVLVHPCTFSYLARLATGLADSPAMLALQCSDVPLVVCPALPPGGDRSPAYRRHLRLLGERPDTLAVPPTSGQSAATGRSDGLPPAHFPDGLEALSALIARREGSGDELAS